MCWQAPTRFEQVTYDRSWAKKQNPVNKKERAGGMPTYAPTVKERKIVEKAAGFGLPHDKICQLIVSERAGKPIDPKTLREVFRVELERGVAVADSEVANALYNNAVHSNNVAAPDLEEQSAHALV
jgi:hypothetical protein